MGQLQEGMQRVVNIFSHEPQVSNAQSVATSGGAQWEPGPQSIGYNIIQTTKQCRCAEGSGPGSSRDKDRTLAVGEPSKKLRSPTTCAGQTGAGWNDCGVDHEASPRHKSTRRQDRQIKVGKLSEKRGGPTTSAV